MPPLKSQVFFFLFALLLGAGLLFVRRTFPLHWLYLKNQVELKLGFTQVDLSLFSNQSSEIEAAKRNSIPWFDTRIQNMRVDGWCGQNLCYQIQARQLEFRDEQIGLVYTPLLRHGHLMEPMIMADTLAHGPITCLADEGRMDPQTRSVTLKSGLICKTPTEHLEFTSVELRPSEKAFLARKQRQWVELHLNDNSLSH